MNNPSRSAWHAHADSDQPAPFPGDGIVRWVLQLPRLLRILLAGLLAVATTLAIFPVVDHLYVNVMFDPATVILPAFISAAAGALVYLAGWRLIVGTVGDLPPCRRAALFYLIFGAFILFLDVFLIVQGLSMVDWAAYAEGSV